MDEKRDGKASDSIQQNAANTGKAISRSVRGIKAYKAAKAAGAAKGAASAAAALFGWKPIVIASLAFLLILLCLTVALLPMSLFNNIFHVNTEESPIPDSKEAQMRERMDIEYLRSFYIDAGIKIGSIMDEAKADSYNAIRSFCSSHIPPGCEYTSYEETLANLEDLTEASSDVTIMYLITAHSFSQQNLLPVERKPGIGWVLKKSPSMETLLRQYVADSSSEAGNGFYLISFKQSGGNYVYTVKSKTITSEASGESVTIHYAVYYPVIASAPMDDIVSGAFGLDLDSPFRYPQIDLPQSGITEMIGNDAENEPAASSTTYRDMITNSMAATSEILFGTQSVLFADTSGLAFSIGKYIWPCPTVVQVISHYGMRKNPFGTGYTRHYGIDIPVPVGSGVLAVADGTVSKVSNASSSARGIYVSIQHKGGFTAIYQHLSLAEVRAGDTIQAGQLIGYSGNTGKSTGPHLHFETSISGKTFDPLTLFSSGDSSINTIPE